MPGGELAVARAKDSLTHGTALASMNRPALYAIACAGVPLAFAGYIHFAYSWSLARGELPFLGDRELRWWIAFGVALLTGTACVAVAQRQSAAWRVLWSALYLVAMVVVLLATHLGIACGHGDCL